MHKTQYTELELRTVALQYAMQIAPHVDEGSSDVVTTAREFYLFMTGKDPVLDVKLEETSDRHLYVVSSDSSIGLVQGKET